MFLILGSLIYACTVSELEGPRKKGSPIEKKAVCKNTGVVSRDFNLFSLGHRNILETDNLLDLVLHFGLFRLD